MKKKLYNAVMAKGKAGAVPGLDAQALPFPIKAIQVDGGSEFQAAFKAACQDHGISLDGRTPAEYLEQCHPSLASAPLSHMYETNTRFAVWPVLC